MPRGGVAVDVGANNGTYAFHLARRAATVLAFEPNPLFSRYLQLMPQNVRVEQVALSNRSGVASLSIPIGARGEAPGWASLEEVPGANRTIEVLSRTLDSYSLAPNFIKIDVEGHEFAVLEGAEQTIRSHRPNLLLELEERHRPSAVADTSALLEKWGYQGHFFVRGRSVPVTEFKAEIHQPDVGISPDTHLKRQDYAYYNNFVFTPR